MSESFQKKMFEPFEQEAEMRRDHIDGQGLGLYIVKTLVDAMDGKITWKRSKDRLAPDLDKLGQDHPDLLTRYVKPVPGSRRFTIQAAHAARRHTP